MLRRFLHILAFLLLWSFPAFAAEVLVVQGERLAPFEEALRGFQGTAGVRPTERIVLSEQRGTDVERAVRAAHPRLVLAVGRDALVRLKDIREIPIVYVMVANHDSTGATGRNVTGVSMNVSPERYLSLLRKVASGKRVGVVFNPAKTGSQVKRARQAAERLGLTLVAREAHTTREALHQIASLKGSVDTLWLFPDATTVTPDTLDALALFSQENHVPVVAFAAKYLEQGALAAYVVDPHAMGQQAGEMARRILDGAAAEDVPAEFAAKASLKVNPTVANHLGISLDILKE